MSPTTPRKSYTAEFKLEVLQYAKENSNREAERKFGVSEKLARDWRKQEGILKLSNKSRKAYRGLKPKWPSLEKKVLEWISTQRASKKVLGTAEIRMKAMELSKELNISDFEGGPSWCRRFMVRQKVRLRPKTNVSKQTSIDQQNGIASSESKRQVIPDYYYQHSADDIRQRSTDDNRQHSADDNRQHSADDNRQHRADVQSIEGDDVIVMDEVTKWMEDQRAGNQYLSYKQIYGKTIELSKELGVKDFKSCENWCYRFFKRQNLCPPSILKIVSNVPNGTLPVEEQETQVIQSTKSSSENIPAAPVRNRSETCGFSNNFPMKQLVLDTVQKGLSMRYLSRKYSIPYAVIWDRLYKCEGQPYKWNRAELYTAINEIDNGVLLKIVSNEYKISEYVLSLFLDDTSSQSDSTVNLVATSPPHENLVHPHEVQLNGSYSEPRSFANGTSSVDYSSLTVVTTSPPHENLGHPNEIQLDGSYSTPKSFMNGASSLNYSSMDVVTTPPPREMFSHQNKIQLNGSCRVRKSSNHTNIDIGKKLPNEDQSSSLCDPKGDNLFFSSMCMEIQNLSRNGKIEFKKRTMGLLDECMGKYCS